MTTVTIFYNDEKWLSKQANCFGVRHDASILPKGSVVVGFMKEDENGHREEILDPPCMTEDQKTNWGDVLDQARTSISK